MVLDIIPHDQNLHMQVVQTPKLYLKVAFLIISIPIICARFQDTSLADNQTLSVHNIYLLNLQLFSFHR